MKSQALKDDPATRRLTDLISLMPDESPPSDFTQSVMQHITPKTSGFWQRLKRRLATPWAVVPIRPLPTVTAAILLIGLVIAANFYRMALEHHPPLTNMAHPQTKIVTFLLDLPSAGKVAVMGTFNHWQPEQFPMHRNPSDGTWQLTVELQPGRYAYAFVIDDTKIIADPRALWEQDDGFGTRNSIITIENGYSDENRI